MGVYYVWSLIIFDPEERLTTELRPQIQKLSEDKGWEIMKETPMCVILSGGGNYVHKDLPDRFPNCDELTMVLSGTHDGSVDNHSLACSVWGNQLWGWFDVRGTDCTAEAIPMETVVHNAIVEKILDELAEEYLASETPEPLSEWLSQSGRAESGKNRLMSRRDEFEELGWKPNLLVQPNFAPLELNSIIEETVQKALAGEFDVVAERRRSLQQVRNNALRV